MEREDSDFHEKFLGLFTANEAAIRAYVRRLVPTRHDAADVMQGIALVLWKKFGQLDEPENFRKWAFGIARFETLAWRRDKARNRLVLADDVWNAVADQSAQAEDKLSSQRDALEDCLNKLPLDQRALVLSAYTPGVQIQETAQRSGRTVGAFYQWLHRVRLRLMECARRTLQAGGAS